LPSASVVSTRVYRTDQKQSALHKPIQDPREPNTAQTNVYRVFERRKTTETRHHLPGQVETRWHARDPLRRVCASRAGRSSEVTGLHRWQRGLPGSSCC
jgi:hypothetical protein